MNNYPDDVRQYDNDPRSPFFEAPPCKVCGQDFDYCDCCEECECEQCECEQEQDDD